MQTKRKSNYLAGPSTAGRSRNKEERGKGFVSRSEGISIVGRYSGVTMPLEVNSRIL